MVIDPDGLCGWFLGNLEGESIIGFNNAVHEAGDIFKIGITAANIHTYIVT